MINPSLEPALHAVLGALMMLTVTAAGVLTARRNVHYFQLESYQFHGYFRTLSRQWDRAFEPGLRLSAAVLAAAAALAALQAAAGGVLLLIAAAVFSALILLYARHILKNQQAEPEKKPFSVTPRVRRLYAALILVLCGLCAALWFLFCAGRQSLLFFTVFALVPLGLPLWTALAGYLAWPVEKLIQHAYLSDAKKKLLANDRLIRIGITGSYGKTSTKFILAAILSQKYNVLATPASFNTPMGLTRVIRERLTPAHQVFIGEMGARHRRDIRELCDLVHPTIGILTSVGPQHLDTFKTIENITATKYDLIEALPADGTAYFQNDGGIVTSLYEKTEKPKLLVGAPGSAAWAEDVKVGPEGSAFTLCLGDGQSCKCETRLLGAHNISNIVCAAAVAANLGLTLRQIQAGISSLTPVEHRLQIVSNAGGVTVIDDAFNTNPTSSKEALRVLSLFKGRRIIVTPGMVELGGQEAQYNREFGEAIADSADLVFLVGRKHTEPIAEGLRSKGFPEDQVFVFASFDEAVAALRPMLQPGDTVMYENDLPDNYSE